MRHNFPVPDEAQLERLLMSVYRRMPDPEFRRLNRIEERLLHRLKTGSPEQKSNKIPWWVVLLMAAGIAGAAWWAGEKWFGKPETQPARVEKYLSEGVRMKEHASEPSGADLKPDKETQENNSFEDKKSPVIYQREDF